MRLSNSKRMCSCCLLIYAIFISLFSVTEIFSEETPVSAAPSSKAKPESVGPVLKASVIKPDSMSLALEAAMAQGFLGAHIAGSGLVKDRRFILGGIWVRSAPGWSAMDMDISVYAGQPATAQNINLIGERVRNFLLDHGHPFAIVNMDFTTREEKGALDLAVLIDAGAGFKYGGFKYSGSRIQPNALERLSLLKFGEAYSENRLRMAKEKLARTGYFEAILPGTLFRDSTRNLLFPSLVLADFKGNHLSGILGYDSEHKGGEGINGYMDIHLINLRGTARDLDFNFESKQIGEGTSSKEARLAYTEPWILSTSVGAKLNFAVSLEDSLYDERIAGIEFFQDLDFHSRYLVSLARQFNRDYLLNDRSTAEIAGLGFLFDARDQVPATLNGIRLSVKVNGVHRDLDDSTYFLVQSLNECAVWGNLGRWVGHTLLSSSGNWPLAGRNNRGELYALGGANTIRGFREKEFITNLFLYGNFEIQFLLAPGSRASVFVVPALINRIEGDINWRRELGYGLGLDSGAKDWTFGISYALNPKRTMGNGFVHMRVTNKF
jgi:outer membrane translocation and assembly module TamA